MSPDPPLNHHRTAASARPRAEPPPHLPAEAAGGGEFFDRLANRNPLWRLTASQRQRLLPAVTAALAAGWTPAALAEATGANTAGIRNPGAVLAARLSPAELPPPTASSARRPPWCGQCDHATRMLDYHGDAPLTCPRCKRPATQVIALHPRQRMTTAPQPDEQNRHLYR